MDCNEYNYHQTKILIPPVLNTKYSNFEKLQRAFEKKKINSTFELLHNNSNDNNYNNDNNKKNNN